MTTEGPTKIENYMTPQGWGSDVMRGHVSHYSEYLLSVTLSIYSTMIAIVLKDYDAVTLMFIYSMIWLLIYTNMSPLTRSRCKVSDTQVTVKARGPLVTYAGYSTSLMPYRVI